MKSISFYLSSISSKTTWEWEKDRERKGKKEREWVKKWEERDKKKLNFLPL